MDMNLAGCTNAGRSVLRPGPSGACSRESPLLRLRRRPRRARARARGRRRPALKLYPAPLRAAYWAVRLFSSQYVL